MAAASSAGGDVEPAPEPEPPAESRLCHYEFPIDDIPGLTKAAEELPHLTIKPSTVDLDRYREVFRDDDLRWTDMSPAAPGFAGYYEDVMRSRRTDGIDAHEFSRRDFHLVNLDRHVDAPGYEAYLQAKTRMTSSLETFFGNEVRFSGSMWYPPFGYRLWHTNETQPGWRMYLIDFDEEIPGSDTASFFRYMNPVTREIVTLQDRPRTARFFKIARCTENLFWHCIVNGASRNRWSFGLTVPDSWMEKIPTVRP
ncbi:hypothetical protein FrEUN1fDRAFT_6433 [Parafrankia sp. EUN1f]|nr:hypothetical protein FrEUN1fDRAFT_6433 [Parafrankia sp. EUN1f]